MPHQRALVAILVFDHQTDVHVVKQDELFASFTVCLHRLVLIHCAGEARDEKAGEGKGLTGARLVLCDQPSGNRHIHFEQAVHRMEWPRQIERVYPHTASRCEIDDLIGSNFRIHVIVSLQVFAWSAESSRCAG